MIRLQQKETVWSEVCIHDAPTKNKVLEYLKQNPNTTLDGLMYDLDLFDSHTRDFEYDTSEDMTVEENDGRETLVVFDEGYNELFNNTNKNEK